MNSRPMRVWSSLPQQAAQDAGLDTTCWVEPWQRTEVDRFGGLVITEAAA